MPYTLNEADKMGKPQGTLDLPFEVVIYSAGKRGHHKENLRICRGKSLNDVLPYYNLTISIIKLFISKQWGMVIIRGNNRWYNRVTFKDGKVTEETS